MNIYIDLQKKFFYFVLFYLFTFTLFAEEEVVDRTIIKSNRMNKGQDNIIKAIGDVEIRKGNKIFNANEVEYNQETKIIKANSDVRVFNEKENNIFFSKTAEMTDDFLKADFYDGIIVFKNGSTITSSHITKINESRLLIDKSDYSICPTDRFDENLTYEQIMSELDNEKTPLFRLKSSTVNANPEKKQLSLWGTSVWFWKIPIFYIPYLKTGLAFQEKLNGFGMPELENTSHYGYGLYIPYNITTEQQKLTLTPKIYEKGNYQLNTKYRAKSLEPDKWTMNFQGDITNDKGESKNLTNAIGITEEEEGDYKNWRGYAALNGHYNFNQLWTFEANSVIASDRYYLRDYYQNGISYIESNFRFTRINMEEKDNFNYFQFSNLFYQELLEENLVYDAPRYAPVTNLNLQNTILKNNYNNLFYKIQLNTTNLYRKTGVEYNRITVTPSLNNTLNTNFGTINANLELRGDLYILNEVGYKTGKYDGTESRLLPQVNIEWRKTFVSQNTTFQPILKYSGSINSESLEKKVPNEDSMPQGISFENIFSNNRFVGYDRQEFGNRITYGFEGTLFNNIGFGLAQGYRDNIDKDDERLIGFEESVSDIVGYISLILNDYFDVNYRFLTDKDNFNFKKNELTLNFNIDWLNVYATYIGMDKNLLYEEEQKQINSGFILTIFGKWKLALSGILDIENDNRLLETKAGLIYDGGCTTWELSYTKYNPLSETDKNTSISFNFSIKFL